MKQNTLLVLLALVWGMTSVFGQTGQNVKINGRIQYDYEFLKRENADQWQIMNEFRRVHLSAAGKLSEVFKYKIEINFSHAQIGFRDVYIEYVSPKWGNFAVGSKAEPTGLDMATSSKYIPFAERAMLTALQDFRWGSGLHYANHHLIDGKAGLQMALTNKGSNTEGFIDTELEKGMNFVSRFYATPIVKKDKNEVLHIGANHATRPYKDIKFRPENHMGDKYHYTVPGGIRRFETGFELAYVYGPYSVQGEYKTSRIAANDNGNYQVNGYYVMGSYFLTGENRPYKKGAFGRVKPAKDITQGGLGAFEVLARYSVMEFSEDLLLIPDNNGLPANIQNIALGLNWYLTSHVRIMYNYIITQDNHPEGNLNTHIVRFQMDF